MSDIDFELGPTCRATVKSNERITPAESDEVRHLVLHVDDPAFRFLEGQTVGSQVLVVIPPKDGYGEGDINANDLKGETLVFVVDIIGAQKAQG